MKRKMGGDSERELVRCRITEERFSQLMIWGQGVRGKEMAMIMLERRQRPDFEGL